MARLATPYGTYVHVPTPQLYNKDVWWVYWRHTFESMITIRIRVQLKISYLILDVLSIISYLYGNKTCKTIDVGDADFWSNVLKKYLSKKRCYMIF